MEADDVNHDHERLGMVLGTTCNVCSRPLTVAGCPLCVTCCDREPTAASRPSSKIQKEER
jgi:hypothetical protein